MQYAMTATHMIMNVNFEELVTMESLENVVYATPNLDDEAVEVYIASQPRFRDDFVLAHPSDFIEASGLDSLGWEEMTEEERHANADEEFSLTVPREKQNRERQEDIAHRLTAWGEAGFETE